MSILGDVIFEVFVPLSLQLLCVHFQERVNQLFIWHFIVHQLMVYDIHLHCDASALVCELEGVRKKVEQYLEYPPLVTHYGLNQIEIFVLVYHCLQLNTVLGCHELKH